MILPVIIKIERFEVDLMYKIRCAVCGKKIDADESLCPYCGVHISNETQKSIATTEQEKEVVHTPPEDIGNTISDSAINSELSDIHTDNDSDSLSEKPDNSKMTKDIHDNIIERVLCVLCYFNIAVIIPFIFVKRGKYQSELLNKHIQQGFSIFIITAATTVIISVYSLLHLTKTGMNFWVSLPYIAAYLMRIASIVFSLLGVAASCKRGFKPFPVINKFHFLKF
jgi:cation transport ATPase